jgi:alpha/beta superfamily hydrolase
LSGGRSAESTVLIRDMPKRAVRAENFELPGPAGALEAILETPAAAPCAAALVCHPHPQYQGTMHNKVAYTLARSFTALGAAALRFNFRGVGASEGGYGGGEGEVEDALAAAAWLRERWPARRLYLAGFSFGALVALRASARLDPTGLVTVAPPLERAPGNLERPRCRWLIVQGERDEVVSAASVEEIARRIDAEAALVTVPGGDHFFHGRLTELKAAVMDFFAEDFVGRAGRRGAGGC